MDKGFENFCLTDDTFYDSPTLARDDDVDFDLGQGPAPVGWTRDELEDWLVYTPRHARFPTQGWKIHSSASLSDATGILQVVWDYCIARQIAFKFVRSPQLLLLANGKYAHRGSSGKFVTIYPQDDEQFQTILTELGDSLKGFQGPYILSDLRWNDGPLYVRYGAFAERYCLSSSGEVTPAIEDDTGRLVPDRRGTTFSVPAWVDTPDCLRSSVEARAATGLGELPYSIDSALHFSNGGGVYVGHDRRTGDKVVLKEARPYAGLAADGSDAVARLKNECAMLHRLADLGVTPAVRDSFMVDDHLFLAVDFVEGESLASTLVDWYPLALLGDEAKFADYTEWALALMRRLTAAVDKVHQRGVVLGDLHPSNILVRPDGTVVLIDLEVATDVDARIRSPLGDPGFAAPSDRLGSEIDAYALASLRLYMFLPLTELFHLDDSKATQFGREIKRRFPVPHDYVDQAVEVITGLTSPSTGRPARVVDIGGTDALDWPILRDSMAAAILSSATPERDDRLFPGDTAQFDSGGLNLAYGAAGVLHALHETGAGRHPDHEDWLVRKGLDPQPGTRFGFYDGLHGVAYALDRLGRRDDALEVLRVCTTELADGWPDLGLDLFSGLAGIGLNLAYFAGETRDDLLWSAAAEVAEYVADELGDEPDLPLVSGGGNPYAGLMRGSSGPALLFLRLHEHFGGEELLDLAATALEQDLRRCVLRTDGALEVNEGYRTMPYLQDGSTGIGLVLQEYLAHREDQRLAEALAAIRVAALSEFYIEPGLFSGRAGMILYLSSLPAQPDRDIVTSHIRRLAWHAVDYQGSLAFPGDQLLRLSMDLATGTAGVLFAVGAALHEAPVSLPFFGPPPADPRAATWKEVSHHGTSRPAGSRDR